MVAHFTLRTHELVFSGKNTRFDDSFDVNKCLQQIEKPDSLHVSKNHDATQIPRLLKGKVKFLAIEGIYKPLCIKVYRDKVYQFAGMISSFRF